MQEKAKELESFRWRVFLALDQALGVLVWKDHDEDETISSRLGRKIRDGHKLNWFQKVLVNILNWIDPNHCIDAIEKDEPYKAEDDKMDLEKEARINALYDELMSLHDDVDAYVKDGDVANFEAACDEIATVNAQLDELEV